MAYTDILAINETAVFNHFGEAATYTPPGGSAVTITVIPKQPDEIVDLGGTRIFHESAWFDVRVSEVALPVEGGVIVHNTTSFTVKGEPQRRDPRRRIWTLETRPT